jgi:hypothetical protein
MAAPYAFAGFIDFAAAWIAARMRAYVPQRQMLVMVSSMSLSLGFGFFLSRATAARICPPWQ